MKTAKHFLMEDIYDYLMENSFSDWTNIRDEFADCWIDCERSIIYLGGSKNLPQFKLTIEEVKA